MDRKYLLRIANIEIFWYQQTKLNHKYLSPFTVLQILEKSLVYEDNYPKEVEIRKGISFKFDCIQIEGQNKYLIYNYVVQ